MENVKKYPFKEKSVSQLVKEIDEAMCHTREMTEEEMIEDDAAAGYFEED